jgi:tetraacyldisaccharide 4'-kinase
MRTPTFWLTETPGLIAQLLRPIGVLYGAITAWRMVSAGASASVPILCVGNFTVGGAGKTPSAIALAKLLMGRGETVYFLSRGHGGRRPPGADPLLVDALHHDAAVVGDEPLLLARVAPTIVSRDRAAGALAAARLGASLIIMDDGMQNPTIAKQCVLVAVDGRTGVGNGLCFPAGPLRAPLRQQMEFAHALIMIGDMAAGRSVATLAQHHSRPVLRARLVAEPAALAKIRGRRLFAFAGIGHPDKFFQMLEQSGGQLIATRAFPDHHPFTPLNCQELRDRAAADEALLVTTEKDLVRLPRGFPALAVPVSLLFASERQVIGLVVQALAKRSR